MSSKTANEVESWPAVERARQGSDLARWDLTKSSVARRRSHGLQTHLLMAMVRRGSLERMFVLISDGRFLKKSGFIFGERF